MTSPAQFGHSDYGALRISLRTLLAERRSSFLDTIGMEKPALDFVRTSGWAFLAGLTADQSVRSVVAWSLPYKLAERMGTADLLALGNREPEAIQEAIRQSPALHRYPGSIGGHLHKLFRDWGRQLGDRPDALWQQRSAAETRSALQQLPGIGPKKASLGVLLLINDLGVEISGTEDIPLAVDAHVRRVLERCFGEVTPGPADSDFQRLAAAVAPTCPGQLSTAIWEVGAHYCRPLHPTCERCPLVGACASAAA